MCSLADFSSDSVSSHHGAGLSHMTEGFHEEGIVPASAFDFATRRCGIGAF
jgi:hypothetical protein